MLKGPFSSCLLMILLIFPSVAHPQDFGFLLGYATSDATIAGGHLIHDDLLFRFSVSFESADTRGEEVTEQKPNYGRTIDSAGDYFTSYDFGVGYYITSAKVEHGNSGGAAILLKDNC